MAPLRLLLVGCGKMGGALLGGWSQKDNLVVSVYDPQTPEADYKSPADIAGPFDIIVLAVKPQVMAEVVAGIRHIITRSTLVLSIAAGKPILFFENLLGPAQPIIRAMPNTPAMIGQGMTVLCGNTNTSEAQRQHAMGLMAAVGEAEWIDDEVLMDAVTAVSGSGPAYVFQMIESLAAAGEAVGLAPALSMKLARQTVTGAAALAASAPTTSTTQLRQNVTSPNGTTAAALQVLMKPADGLTNVMTRAVMQAKARSIELAKD